MKSIRRQLTWRLLLGFALLWVAGGSGVYWMVRVELTREFDQTLRATAQTLVAATDVNEEGELELDQDSDASKNFQIWFPDQSTWRRSGAADLPRRTGVWNLRLPDHSRGRALGFLFVPRQENQTKTAPELTLVVARSRRELDHVLQLIGAALLAGAVLLPVAAAWLVASTVRRGLRPLAAVGERAAGIDAHSLATRFPTAELPAELRPICERLNDLLARLEESFARERRFSADVAHELRTPIAELRTLAEVALKWPDDPGASKRTLEEALAIALQMETIATQSLALARCESGRLSVHSQPVRLAPLIRELWEPLSNHARTKGLTVSLDVSDDECWLTDADALRTILNNLLSNAVEYCPEAGVVRLRVESDGRRERLLLTNTTDNIVTADLPHLFELFWRKDEARSSGAHCGLGLALTKAYSEALGLQLDAALTSPAELTLRLTGARRA